MTSSSNSPRSRSAWAVLSDAWSIVVVSVAVAWATLRRLRVRWEAGTLGLWKRVTTSKVRAWEVGISWWLLGMDWVSE